MEDLSIFVRDIPATPGVPVFLEKARNLNIKG
jgi:hypothetical protein